MRELKKPNFVKNKKLVKTTTFLAILLIATTLLLSSSVTAISISGDSTTMNNTAKPITGSIRDLSPNVKASLKADSSDRAMWDVQFSLDVTTASGAAGNAGAEWDGSYFYTNRWASNLIHKYNPDGTLVGAYTITGVSGLRDLAFDGTYMWGGNGAGTLWKMDFNSWTLLTTFTGTFQVRAIAYDTDLNIVYVSGWADPVWKIDPATGAILGQFNLVTTVSTYGFAYDGLTAGGPFLWVYDQGAGAGTPQYIHQWDLAAGAYTGLTHATTVEFPDPSGIAGGLFFTDSFVPGYSTLGGLQQGVPDRLFCYEMAITILPEHDVAVKSIDAPSSGPAAGSFTPKVTIVNNGNNSETTDVNLKIKKYTVPNVLLTEGFESWTAAASAIFPPAGWAVYNVLGTNTWARYATASYNKIGIYSAISGYTVATTNDDWLATKGVVVGSCDNKFSFWYRSYSTSYSKTIKVWMSTTGNTVNDFTVTGTLLATIGPFTTTTYTQYVYDATAYIGQTLYFAVEDVSTTAYYVHVDGFILPNGEVQNFEGILTGWQTEWVTGTTDYDNEWDCIGSATSPTATPHGGAWMARYRCYSISSAHSARFKKLAPISLPSADIINMKLWFYHYYTGTQADKVDVQLSTNGCTWTTIKTINRYVSPTAWKEYTIDLSAYAGQTVYLSFLGTSYFGYNIYIDDLSIYTQSIVTEYDQIKTTSIAIGETKQITFPNWAPVDWHNPATENVAITYDLEATSLLVDDNMGNNYKEKSIVLNYPYLHDIAVLSVNSPVDDGPAQTLPVECTIKNVGQYQECCYQTQMQIGKVALGAVILDEPFTVNSWTVTNTKWSKVSSNYAGGTAPEYRFYYSPSETGTFLVYSPPINTVGAAAAKLSWKHMVNHYTTPYTLAVMTSTDAINWKTVWSMAGASHPAGTEEITVSEGIGSSTFRIAFAFIGYSYNINYWYVDDVKLQAMNMIPEYTDTVCTIVLDPGEQADLEFDDWTPADLALGISGDIGYVTAASQLLPGDTNPANDIAGSDFTLEYWHDVKVKDITSPAMDRGDVIFSQEPYLPTESWSFYTTSVGGGYICYDDFWDLTDTIGDIEFWGLCLIYSGGWTAGNPNTLPFEVKFYEAGATPGAVVNTFTLPAITPVNTGLTYSGFTMYYWAYDLPSSVALANGWMSIQSTAAPDNAWLLWSGSPDGNLNALQGTTALLDSLAFNLSKGGVPGPANVEVWVPLNADKSIAGIVQNLGTFVENDLTCYAEIYEYITDPNGTLVYTDSIPDIDLTPLGNEEALTFDNYVFAMQGVYNVQLNIPLPADNDDFPANNLMKLGIGCDNTKPVSTHSLNPATPNGLNGWYVSDLTVTLDANDGTEDWQSGVKEIAYKIGDGPIKTIPGGHGSFKVEDDGENILVKYWAVDKVGNTEAEHSFTVDMDQTKPTISMNYEVTGNQVTGWIFTFIATASDEMSGMERVEFYFNDVLQETVTGSGPTYTWEIEYTPIPDLTVKGIAYDIAGNNDYDEIENPDTHSNEQSIPNSATTIKLNLGR